MFQRSCGSRRGKQDPTPFDSQGKASKLSSTVHILADVDRTAWKSATLDADSAVRIDVQINKHS